MSNIYTGYSVDEFDKLYQYDGELGAIYSKEKTVFRLWSPLAESVKVILFGKNPYLYNNYHEEVIDMNYKCNGIWEVEVEGDLDGEFYNYRVKRQEVENEVVDPYAKAVGVNGNRGMVVDLNDTNPLGWYEHKVPKFNSPLDAIIYEAHIRDFTIDDSCGIEKDIKGKFKAFYKDTSYLNDGRNIGINHLKDLGVNVIQLLPVFDYKTVNEMNYNEEEYNWGYDPLNYNVPEGSYATNPYEGKVRIREFKELIMQLHELGFKVVMDVVFNHTADTENSNFNKIVPKYYYRQNEFGDFSNGSGCGNELASERAMVRKFILDSVKYWVDEYKIDGFRFDLMGLHDIDTMKEIRLALRDDILIYGEGWKADKSPMDNSKLSLKENVNSFGNLQIGVFSDDIRDAIKGSVFEREKGGFINGVNDFDETIKFGIVASTKHKDIDFNKLLYSKRPWANEPHQVITYTSAHDNYTMWDKISLAEPISSKEERIKMNKLAAAIILTSQGIPFIHSGDEILRSKREKDGSLVENSYKSSDYVNKFDWSRKEKYIDIFNYYKKIINLRKNHKIFRMDLFNDINENINFLKEGVNFNQKNIVAYILDGHKFKDSLEKVIVIFNGNKHDVKVKLDHNRFLAILDDTDIDENGIYEINDSVIKVKGISALILKYL
ncbi:MAG: type I pullulanase [Clostridium sp.]|uniref:type I pullulanase n=1 Tax=Clostridium sp. TaxID=1506 RepID=UPI0025BDB371|nr:type I pullulanase [Clostridium sp.]MCF0149749.1 type I pullulanase [Clostridium sp.]